MLKIRFSQRNPFAPSVKGPFELGKSCGSPISTVLQPTMKSACLVVSARQIPRLDLGFEREAIIGWPKEKTGRPSIKDWYQAADDRR